MRYKIRWTTEAEQTFSLIIEYLERQWSEREVRNFIRVVNATLKKIASFPYLFKASAVNPTVRKGFLTKQCSPFYEVGNENVTLLYFWDNRQNQ